MWIGLVKNQVETIFWHEERDLLIETIRNLDMVNQYDNINDYLSPMN
jgi:hypothetical protein